MDGMHSDGPPHNGFDDRMKDASQQARNFGGFRLRLGPNRGSGGNGNGGSGNGGNGNGSKRARSVSSSRKKSRGGNNQGGNNSGMGDDGTSGDMLDSLAATGSDSDTGGMGMSKSSAFFPRNHKTTSHASWQWWKHGPLEEEVNAFTKGKSHKASSMLGVRNLSSLTIQQTNQLKYSLEKTNKSLILRLQMLDPRSDMLLNRMAALINSSSVSRVWNAIDIDRSGAVSLKEVQDRNGLLGFSGRESIDIFRAIDAHGSDIIRKQDLLFLQKWNLWEAGFREKQEMKQLDRVSIWTNYDQN
jgi:hypothetical protein